MKKKKQIFVLLMFASVLLYQDGVKAMHIMEGFLPVKWALFWLVATLPFFILGLRRLNAIFKDEPEKKLLVALAGAFVFLLSALKLPSVTGSCSHPTGTGLGAILFGPSVMSVLGVIVLLFQALLLAHGGLTTIGANAFSMAVAGPFITYGLFLLLRKFKVNLYLSVFIATATGNLATYVITSLQLGFAFPDPLSGIIGSSLKFMAIFALTQIPIAMGEGLLSALIFNKIKDNEKEGILYEEIY
ncbi:energy-coupling factor ABC transporter permease [Alkalibacter mobilis]|uniref:energy-coupling factor ABC transporter permease n=1 Tax=Alkalibacter mobilis TaxID=2787712 RepID=UPI00189D01ED|nr:energy-coupling factor ABC transporter permease [Alkalibacter mobilis]